MTIAQACEALRITRWTLWRLIRDGEVAAQKTDPNVKNSPVRVEVTSVHAYIHRHIQPGPSTTGDQPMSTSTLPHLHTLAEVAEQVGLPLTTLRRGCRTGEYEHTFTPYARSDGSQRGARYMTDEQIHALVEMLKNGGEPAAPDPEAATIAREMRRRARTTQSGKANQRGAA